MLAKQIVQKCKKIKVIISDVDGVLTDGGMYYSEKGEVLIKLLENGIKTILITGENSRIVKARAKKIKASSAFIGISKKELLLPKICKKYNVSNSEIAYIGDDLNDYKIMKKVGFSATPSDGIAEIKLVSDYVCKIKGGHGAFREFCDLILNYQK